MYKIAFQLGPLTIAWYGIFVASGFLIGLWTASRRAVQAGIAAEKIIDLGPWLVLGGIVGSRILYVVAYWNEYFAHQPFWEIFMIHHGGLIFYGGLAGATLAGVWYVRRQKLSALKIADVLAPSIALGHAFGRVGCLMNGCCYGLPTSLPWAIRFPSDHETFGAPVHPTQIYSALLNLGLSVFLSRLFIRRKYDGQIFAIYLVSYSMLRSFIELFRGDYAARYVFGLITSAHVFSVVIFAIGLWMLWQLPRTQKEAPSE